MSDLKPCPFCGGKAAIGHEKDFDGFGEFYFVQCTESGCRAKSGEKFTSEVCPIFMGEVRDLWNNRPHENKLKADAVREAVNFLERPDVPLAPSLILSDDLNEYADKLEKGES